MTNIFDITSEDIKCLNDGDLRNLVGLLCEADYRFANIRTSGIHWSGNQDAADGGLDVVVKDLVEPPQTSSIPRSYTGFQVKVSDMPPSKILSEMRKNGDLKESIKSIIAAKGAYIIVSSKSSTSFSAYRKRVDAMREAISNIGGYKDTLVDFYDSGRIATWVRTYPSMVLWVKSLSGRLVRGWLPFGNWSGCPSGSDEYIIDEAEKFYWETDGNSRRNTVDTLHHLRNKLKDANSFIRLVGLSGVGKTRFVQALFDKNIGENFLDPVLAIYANMSDHLNPDPATMATYLSVERRRAILIVDNCSPELHKKLVQICLSETTFLSLITIEYDVRDDLPEETDVICLEPIDEGTIPVFLAKRFPEISPIDVRTIAELSGGNYRVAIALASTLKHGETLGQLRDDSIFKRLFHQTNEPNEHLLKCAEVLSIVYSFNGVDIDSANSELLLLAGIIDVKVIDLFRCVAELQKRQLVQSRGPWRAILPHAIANKLAEHALQYIPNQRILEALLASGNNRLLYSFSHRLSFLHNSIESQKIVSGWLSKDGWLGKTRGDLTPTELKIIKNIAPVLPAKFTSLIEYWVDNCDALQNLCGDDNRYQGVVTILNQTAYDDALFDASVSLIAKLFLYKRSIENKESCKDELRSLFYISFSRTHASLKTRSEFINKLWNGTNDQKELALSLLDPALEALHFFPCSYYGFGARPRNWGWCPNDDRDVSLWFETFIELALKFEKADIYTSRKIRKMLGDKFRNIWIEMKIYKLLINVCDKLNTTIGWKEGWYAVRETLKYHSNSETSESLELLRDINKRLLPCTLEQRIEVYVMSEINFAIDITGCENNSDNVNELERKVADVAEELGREISQNIGYLGDLLPNIISKRYTQAMPFGKGLVDGAKNKMEMWQLIHNSYRHVPQEEINVDCLLGALSSSSISSKREEILNTLVTDSILGGFFPLIQAHVGLAPIAIPRLVQSLNLNNAPLGYYECLGWGGAHEAFNDDELAYYLKEIQKKDDGILVVLYILDIRFSPTYFPTNSILELSKDIILNFPYHKKNFDRHRADHSLANLIEKVVPIFTIKDVKMLCSILYKQIEININYVQFPDLINKFARLFPLNYLDTFLLPRSNIDNISYRIFGSFEAWSNPLDHIDSNTIVEWCDSKCHRYLAIARSIKPFVTEKRERSFDWHPLVYSILIHAPNTSEVLEILRQYIVPTSWGGSKAQAIYSRLVAIKKLIDFDNVIVAEWAIENYQWTEQLAKREEREDIVRNKDFYQSFE